MYGFGERKTNHAFIAACDKFLYFDVLNMPAEEPGQAVAQQQQHPKSVPPAHATLDTPSTRTTPYPPGTLRITTPPPHATAGVPSSSFFTLASPGGGASLAAPRQQGKRPLDAAALEGLRLAINNSQEDSASNNSYVNLASLGLQLSKISPELNARNYGYEKLWDFLEASGIAELKRRDMGDKPPVALVRLKEGGKMQ